MARVPQFQDVNFDSEVLASDQPVLVEFGAAWCPPCRAMEPHIEALAIEYAGRVKVGTVDTDESQLTAAKFGIRGIPTTILFKAGKPVASVVGAVPRRKLEELITSHLG